MSFRRIAAIVIAVAVIAAVSLLVLSRGASQTETADEEAQDTNNVTVDTGVDRVGAEGEVIPVRHVTLSAATSGPVAEIFVAEGDLVQEGDPLLRLDATDQEIALQQAEAGLAQASANLESAQAGLRAARAAERLAELGVEAAEAQLALAEAQPQDELVAVSELGVAAAEAGITAAAGNQALVVESASDSQVLASQAALRAAQQTEKVLRDALNSESNEEAEEQLALQLNAAVANVNAAQVALEELRAGATSGERLAASAAVQEAIARRDAAQAQLDLLLAGTREERVAVSEVAVRQAEATLAEARLATSRAESAVRLADAAMAQAQTVVDAAQEALDAKSLTAPFSGTVSFLDIEVGEVASPGVPVVTLADFSEWLVETMDLTEMDVVSVGVGFPVVVNVDALPGENIEGRVSDIATISGLFGGDVTYLVTVRLEDTGELPLRWGMTAEVEIDVEP